MWIFRWLVLLVTMIYAVLFAAMNLDQIAIRFPYPISQDFQLEKAIVVLGGIGVGIVLWALISFFGGLERRGRMRDLERTNQSLKDELTRLRNISLLDDHDLFGQESTHAPVGSNLKQVSPSEIHVDGSSDSQSTKPKISKLPASLKEGK
jgi:uncharacterized integral membrane protein